jgi:hypothetical protein
VLITSLPKYNLDSECAAAFISKPFGVEQIESVVRTLLRSNQESDQGNA